MIAAAVTVLVIAALVFAAFIKGMRAGALEASAADNRAATKRAEAEVASIVKTMEDVNHATSGIHNVDAARDFLRSRHPAKR